MAKQKKEETKDITSRNVKDYIISVLVESDWVEGYKFRGSEYFYLSNISIKNRPSKTEVDLLFTITYQTKTRTVKNDVTWKYTYKNVVCLKKNINTLENDITCKTGDKDDVFGSKFNKKLFEERSYEKKGWKIIR